MLSYGGVALQIPSVEESAWINSRIAISEAFGFFRSKAFADPNFNPRIHFAWALARPFKVNALYHPWGASRFSYAFVLADKKMRDAINAQNADGSALPFKIDDGVGSSITTNLFQLPAVPLSKIMTVSPQLPLHLLPLVCERYRFWERSAKIDIVEGTTTWSDLYEALATALGITLTADPFSEAYLKPSNGFTKHYEHLPMLLDLAASSVGHRIVRRLSGAFYSRSATTANSLQIAQANLYAKFAGGSLDMGVIDA